MCRGVDAQGLWTVAAHQPGEHWRLLVVLSHGCAVGFTLLGVQRGFENWVSELECIRCSNILVHGCCGEYLACSMKDTIAGANRKGTRQQCVSAARRALQSGASCVIDRCNYDADQRKDFVALARLEGCQVGFQCQPECTMQNWAMTCWTNGTVGC